jgi:hypothetical protein
MKPTESLARYHVSEVRKVGNILLDLLVCGN